MIIGSLGIRDSELRGRHNTHHGERNNTKLEYDDWHPTSDT